jgi:serine acetyltransferase
MTANPDTKMPSGVLGVVWRDVATNLRHQGLPVTWGRLFACLAWSRGVQAVEIYRLSHYLRRRGIPVLPELLMRLNQLVFTADIYPEAEIGSGFMLIHPCNVVIGKGTVIGNDVQIFNGVSLGNRLTERAERLDDPRRGHFVHGREDHRSSVDRRPLNDWG